MDLLNIFENFIEVDNLTSFVTISITLLGGISLFIANMSRYIQAKKFGIPIRAIHQANISDSADLWVAFVGTLGFGIFIPIVMLNVEVNWWIRLIVVFLAFGLGLFSTKNLLKVGTNKKVEREGKEYTVTRDFPVALVSCVALVTAFAYMGLYNLYYAIAIAEISRQNDFFANLIIVVAVIIQSIYLLLLLGLLVLNVMIRISGNSETMTTVIEEQSYLITMRHNTDKWILLSCEIEDYKKGNNDFFTEAKVILFEKGKFIIKDLSTLVEPINCHTNSGVVEKGKF